MRPHVNQTLWIMVGIFCATSCDQPMAVFQSSYQTLCNYEERLGIKKWYDTSWFIVVVVFATSLGILRFRFPKFFIIKKRLLISTLETLKWYDIPWIILVLFFATSWYRLIQVSIMFYEITRCLLLLCAFCYLIEII